MAFSARCLPAGRCRPFPKNTDKRKHHDENNYQDKTASGGIEELGVGRHRVACDARDRHWAAMKEGCSYWALATGLQVMTAMMEESLTVFGQSEGSSRSAALSGAPRDRAWVVDLGWAGGSRFAGHEDSRIGRQNRTLRARHRMERAAGRPGSLVTGSVTAQVNTRRALTRLMMVSQ